jgi:uridine kinase
VESIVIGIAGGTGSGKSTFTNRLKAAFPREVAVIYHDNYYRAQDHIPFEQRVNVNYDHPDSLETELLVEHLKALRAGQAVECPVYDYALHTRSNKTICIQPRPIILLEGILVLGEPALLEQMDIKIFVEADADERILRRVRRDVKERGRDLDGIINQYLTTVKPMHEAYVEPTKANADLVINSGLNDVAFEVIAGKIRSVLARCPVEAEQPAGVR